MTRNHHAFVPFRSLASGVAVGLAGFAWGCESEPGVTPLDSNTETSVACDSDKDCRDWDGVCDLSRRVCVGCLAQADCSDDEVCTSGNCQEITPCESSKACEDDQVCATMLGYCTECARDADCAEDELCVEYACLPSCDSDRDCSATDQVCDLGLAACVDCTSSADCDDAQYCGEQVCREDACEPQASSCQDGELLTCAEDGSRFESHQCEDGCDEDGERCLGDTPATSLEVSDAGDGAEDDDSPPEDDGPRAGGGAGGDAQEPEPQQSTGGTAPNGGNGGMSNVAGMGGAAQGGASNVGGSPPLGSAGGGAGGVAAAGGTPGCSGLDCEVGECGAGVTTALVGTVTAPDGLLPVYNALVYVPNGSPGALPTGAVCERCGAAPSGDPLAMALSDPSGNFRLEGVPSGEVPLVVQLGKWRRSTTISVSACAENQTPAEATRLPKNQAEGNMPRIAVSTGGSDALECLLVRLGIDVAEFTLDTGNGAVHLYAGGDGSGEGAGASSFAAGGTFPDAVTTLWPSLAKMQTYDSTIMSCEGSSLVDAKEPFFANFTEYVGQGGRVLMNHMHFPWLRNVAEFEATAQYIGVGDALPEPTPGIINTTFPKGAALSSWLGALGATPTPGEVLIYQGEHSVAGVNPPTMNWIDVSIENTTSQTEPSTQLMTFNTPVGVPAVSQCGRITFADLHVGARVGETGGDSSDPYDPFPTGCAETPSSPMGLALMFSLLDSSSCVEDDTVTPTVPPL